MLHANRLVSILGPGARSSLVLMILVLVILGLAGAAMASPGAPTHLRCEYQENPIAITESEPRLSWWLGDTRRGALQTAYQIQVASDARKLRAGVADVWDSGKVASRQSIHVSYAGFPVRTGRAYCWRVRTWDTSDVPSPFSEIASWEMTLRESVDWKARWIHVPPVEASMGGDPPGWKHGSWIWHAKTTDNQTVCLRKTFTLDASAKVTKARVRTTTDDSFVLFINGRKIGAGKGWSQTADFRVAGKLRAGQNVVAVEARNGASLAGTRLAMRIDLSNGQQVWIRSDKTWKVSDKVEKDWTTAGFNDGAWSAPRVIGKYGCKPWGGRAVAAKKRGHRSMVYRRDFSLGDGGRAIRRARAYVCGLGAYELRINGQRVGDDILTPGWTFFRTRTQFQTYDVTKLLSRGRNAIGAILGNGWWHGQIGGERNQPGRDSLRLIVQLDITYSDGSAERVKTDTDWKACISPIARDSIYDGEAYDARLERKGWDQPGYDDSAWLDVAIIDHPIANLVPQAKPTIKAIQDLPAVKVTEFSPGVFVFDFGQNLVGWVRLKVEGETGEKVKLRHAEVIKDGKFYVDNLRKAKATDTYILKGDGVEVWEPKFTYHGFRYVEVTGFPGKPNKDALVARMICSAEPQTGRFECSHDLINKIQHNLVWGLRGNMYSVPTDCPQRDERLGWMGDAQMFANTSCWNLHMARFYVKWMRDIADCQGPDGATRDWNPTNDKSPAKPAWGDACVITPYQVYRHYGDTRIIEENWDCMVGWVDYLTKHSKGNLFERDGYADWIAVLPSPKKPISAAYYYYDCVLLSLMGRAIGKDAEADKYAELARKIRDAFNDKFLNHDTSQYPGGTQTANLLPLFFRMVPPHRVDAVAGNVVADILKRRVHLTTGFLGTGYINPVLTQTGHHDLAWRLAKQTTYPSWGYMVRKGATTIWELWNSDTKGPGMNSRNHFCLGSVGEWFFESLAGITMTAPGFRTIRIQPRPADGLTWARGDIETMYGPAASHWRLDNGDLHMDVRIPANTSARILVPTFGGSEYTVSESGTRLVKTGRHVGSTDGITFVGMEGDWVTFRAGAGQFALVAHGVGAPRKVAYDLPPAPPTVVELSDDFTGNKIDDKKWQVIDMGLESNAGSGIKASVVDGVLTFSGKTNVNHWAGKTLMSRGGFAIPKSKQLEVSIERLDLAPTGSGTRTSLWLWADPHNYFMFSQDTETGTWSYNADGARGNGVEVAKAADNGKHVMKLIHDGDSVRVVLDGKKLADVKVGWSGEIRIAVTGQARQKGDGLTARFDNVRAKLTKTSSGK